MQEHAKTLSTGLPKELETFYNQTGNRQQVEYFPYIKVTEEKEFLLKKPGEENTINLGTEIKARVLAVFQTYAYYDKDAGRNTVQSTKFTQGSAMYVVDSNFSEATLCKTKDDIKAVKDIYYEMNQRLKFSKVAYIEILEGPAAGTVAELYIRLSHNYKCVKKNNEVMLDFNSPLEDSFDSFMQYANNRYPFNIVSIKADQYTLYPSIYNWLRVVSLGEDPDLNFDLVNQTLTRVVALNESLVYGMTIKEKASRPGSYDYSKIEIEKETVSSKNQPSIIEGEAVFDGPFKDEPKQENSQSIADQILNNNKKTNDDDLPF